MTIKQNINFKNKVNNITGGKCGKFSYDLCKFYRWFIESKGELSQVPMVRAVLLINVTINTIQIYFLI